MIDVAVRRQQGSFGVDMAFATDGVGITALFGRSGSGKTSVVNMVAGLARPDEGHIEIAGRLLFHSRKGIDLPPERRRCGYVFQDARLFPHMSVRANLCFGMRRAPATERYVDFDQVVALLGLEHLLDRRPGRLSGGEKQRVAIGRALLASPRILLMDEPVASLDATRKAEVLPFIARLPQAFNIPILYVSHSMDEILRLCDTLVLIDHGRAAAVGTVEELTSRIELRPLTGRYVAGAVLRAVVAAHDARHGLTHLAFPGGTLKVGRLDLPEGSAVRVRLHARDIALALESPKNVSVQNVFAATIAAITPTDGHLVHVALDVAGSRLWAQVTSLACSELQLRPGQPVFAMVKSVAIARADVADWAED